MKFIPRIFYRSKKFFRSNNIIQIELSSMFITQFHLADRDFRQKLCYGRQSLKTRPPFLWGRGRVIFFLYLYFSFLAFYDED